MTQNVTIIHYTISYPFFTCFQNDKTLSNIASIIADSHSCGGTDGNNFDTSSLIDVRGWRVTTSSSVVVPFSDPDFRAFIQDLNEFTCSDTVENNDCNLLLVALSLKSVLFFGRKSKSGVLVTVFEAFPVFC